jgi:hypothetical protein
MRITAVTLHCLTTLAGMLSAPVAFFILIVFMIFSTLSAVLFLNDAKEVSENFNSFFSTVADKIGHNVVYDPSTHPSIVEIKNHVDIDNNFGFQNITAERVEKIINTINIEKATGADNIPAKVVKQCKVTVAQQLSSLINLSINTGVFPDSLKVAQVTPIHKQNDPLNK